MVRWEVPPSRRVAFVVVLVLMVASVLVAVTVDWRVGGYLLAGSLATAAVLRAVLPERLCLGLLVRSRRLDVLMATVFAVAIAVATTSVPAGPGG